LIVSALHNIAEILFKNTDKEPEQAFRTQNKWSNSEHSSKKPEK